MATKAFRFALGDPGHPISRPWRVWTHEDEAHLGVRSTSTEVHLTAYPTGRWRIVIGSDVSKWTRPGEFRPGWTRGPDLIIPFTAAPVRQAELDPFVHETLAWLPPPAPGHQARFVLLFASPRAEGSQWRPQDAPGTQSVVVLPLRTLGALHLNRVDEVIPPEDATLPFASRVSNSGAPVVAPVGFEVIVSADQTGRPTLRVSYTG
jgi:hypothetical protein